MADDSSTYLDNSYCLMNRAVLYKKELIWSSCPLKLFFEM